MSSFASTVDKMEHAVHTDRGATWTPALMDELRVQRAPFAESYDEYWRRERLYRYVYWLKHADHPPFNLLGSWSDNDIVAETRMWKELASKCVTDEEVENELANVLESRFGFQWEAVLQFGTSSGLAEDGLPIWNAATGSLLPERFGGTKMAWVTDHKPSAPGTNMGYSYRNLKDDETLDLYIYRGDPIDIADGASDERLVEHLRLVLHDASVHKQQEGCHIGQVGNVEIEKMASHSGTKCEFLSVYFSFQDAGGQLYWSGVSVTGFRGHIAKVRYTARLEFVESDAAQPFLEQTNVDLADFLGWYRKRVCP